MKQVLTTPRLLLAAPGSGNGKTTLSCGLLWALKRRFEKVKSFKCGPDYIDPMFHAKMLGSDCRNLDLFLSGEEGVRFLLGRWARDCGFALMEGVMGLYDGLGADSQTASTNHLALATGTPTVLVVRPKGMSLSLKALLSGFLNFSENRIRGVIFNQCSKGMYPVYSKMAKELGLVPCGFLPPLPEAELGSRHLGLITAQEVEDLEKKLELLGRAAEENLDLDALCQLAEQAQPMEYQDLWEKEPARPPVCVAVAQDKAFCFTYRDNLDLLEQLGARILFFSPLAQPEIPREADALWLREATRRNGPRPSAVTAPCWNPSGKRWPRGCPPSPNAGGFLCLLSALSDREGRRFPMAGPAGRREPHDRKAGAVRISDPHGKGGQSPVPERGKPAGPRVPLFRLGLQRHGFSGGKKRTGVGLRPRLSHPLRRVSPPASGGFSPGGGTFSGRRRGVSPEK